MQKGDYLTAILRSNKTVLTFRDIALLWQDTNIAAARVRLNYFVKRGDLCRIYQGIYTKSNQYDKYELATRIYTPAYISFETVLAKEGIIFQFQTAIRVASYLTRSITVDNQTYLFNKLKDQILTNSTGIEHVNEISIACKERAFLDILYTNANFYFDNIRFLDWDKVFAILPIYDNKRLAKSVNKLFKKI